MVLIQLGDKKFLTQLKSMLVWLWYMQEHKGEQVSIWVFDDISHETIMVLAEHGSVEFYDNGNKCRLTQMGLRVVREFMRSR